MKKNSGKLISAALAGLTTLISFSGFSDSLKASANEMYEYAEFPLRTMCVTQLAFESASHGTSYHMDCSGKYEEYAVAPFTGKVVYSEKHYGLVLFQSSEPVHYADGSLDYMTVIFMHCANTDELGQLRDAETEIPQGADLIRCGGIGRNGIEEYVRHYDIGVYRGAISSPSDAPEAGGYFSRLGNLYPFEGFYVDPSLTVNIVNWGKLASGNTLTKGTYSDWQNCWVMLNAAETPALQAAVVSTQPPVTTTVTTAPVTTTAATTAETTTAAPETTMLTTMSTATASTAAITTTSAISSQAPAKKLPEKPLVSVSSMDEVTISYQDCENATYYNIRIYDKDSKEIAYCVGVCEDANPFNECRAYTETSLSHALAPGSYYVRVTAVNKADGTLAASDAVSFEVTLPDYAGSGDLDGNNYVNDADIRLMTRCISGNADLKQSVLLAADMNFDGILNAADLSLLKRNVIAQKNAA